MLSSGGHQERQVPRSTSPEGTPTAWWPLGSGSLCSLKGSNILSTVRAWRAKAGREPGVGEGWEWPHEEAVLAGRRGASKGRGSTQTRALDLEWVLAEAWPGKGSVGAGMRSESPALLG